MKIALLQMQPHPAAPEANLARIAQAARAAKAFGAQLLVTPELSLTGYAIGDDLARLAQGRGGPMVTALSRLAVDLGLNIVAGFPERDGAALYNCVALARAEGGALFYRKCHLYGAAEKARFKPSDTRPALFEIGGMKAGLLVCYDLEFPEMARALALKGAQLIIVPTALPASPNQCRVAQHLAPARAMENHVFIVYADLCGVERDTHYEGGSAIVGPGGEELARAGRGEALLIATLDRTARDAAMRENPYLDDRRPELYESD